MNAPVVFIDTVGILTSRRPSREDIDFLAGECGKKPWRGQSRYGRKTWQLVLYQPSAAAIEWLATESAGVLQWLDVAVDLETATEGEADIARKWIEQHLVHPRRRRAGEVYQSASYSTRRFWSTWGWVTYSDHPSKVTGQPCCHLELRIKGTDVVRRFHLQTCDLPHLDLLALILLRLNLRQPKWPAVKRLIGPKRSLRVPGRSYWTVQAIVDRARVRGIKDVSRVVQDVISINPHSTSLPASLLRLIELHVRSRKRVPLLLPLAVDRSPPLPTLQSQLMYEALVVS